MGVSFRESRLPWSITPGPIRTIDSQRAEACRSIVDPPVEAIIAVRLAGASASPDSTVNAAVHVPQWNGVIGYNAGITGAIDRAIARAIESTGERGIERGDEVRRTIGRPGMRKSGVA